MNEVAHLYQAGKVDKRKAETIVRKLTSGRALGSEKGRAMLHEVKGALPKKAGKAASTREMKTYFISGTAKTTTYYYRTRNKIRAVKFNKPYHHDYASKKTIRAPTRQEAEEEFRREMQNDFALNGTTSL